MGLPFSSKTKKYNIKTIDDYQKNSIKIFFYEQGHVIFCHCSLKDGVLTIVDNTLIYIYGNETYSSHIIKKCYHPLSKKQMLRPLSYEKKYSKSVLLNLIKRGYITPLFDTYVEYHVCNDKIKNRFENSLNNIDRFTKMH